MCVCVRARARERALSDPIWERDEERESLVRWDL
jgi:hypothetical protein